MPTLEQALENTCQAHLRHCRFVETRQGDTPVTEAQIRRGWDAMCLEAGQRKEEARKRAGVLLAQERGPGGEVVKRPLRGAKPLLPVNQAPKRLPSPPRGPEIPKIGLRPGSVPMP